MGSQRPHTAQPPPAIDLPSTSSPPTPAILEGKAGDQEQGGRFRISRTILFEDNIYNGAMSVCRVRVVS